MNDNNELLKYRQLSNSKLIDSCRKFISNLSKLLSDLNTEVHSKNFGLGSDSFFAKFQKVSDLSSSMSICTNLLSDRNKKNLLLESEIKSIDFLEEQNKIKQSISKIYLMISAKIDNANNISKMVIDKMVFEAQQNSCYNNEGFYIDQGKIELKYPKSLVNTKNN
jgi:hypothetical protein